LEHEKVKNLVHTLSANNKLNPKKIKMICVNLLVLIVLVVNFVLHYKPPFFGHNSKEGSTGSSQVILNLEHQKYLWWAASKFWDFWNT
jgi:hypothetical protein